MSQRNDERKRRQILLKTKEKETGELGSQTTSQYRVSLARQLSTDWPREFHPWEPCIRPGGSDQDETTLPGSAEDQPRPGPSARPTSVRDLPNSMHQRQGMPLLTRGEEDKPVNERQSTLLLTEGERDRLTPIISTNTHKKTVPTQTRGYKIKGKGQQKSVSDQEPEEQHFRQDKTLDPEPVRERAVGPGGHSY